MKKLFKNPLFILGAAVSLLVLSGVGSTKAALNQFSDDIKFSFKTAQLGVAMYENGEELDGENGVLLSRFSESDKENEEVFHIGQKYEEVLSIANISSAYDCFARIVINRSWIDENGNKDTFLDPTLIQFEIPTVATIVAEDGSTRTANWLLSESENGEQIICYLDRPINIGERVDLTKSISVNDAVTTDATNNETANTITTTYNYQNHSFLVEASIEAVQTHNAADAICGAWGIETRGLSDDNLVISSIVDDKKAYSQQTGEKTEGGEIIEGGESHTGEIIEGGESHTGEIIEGGEGDTHESTENTGETVIHTIEED